MNRKIIFTALILGGALVYALHKMTQSSKPAQKGPARMGANVPKMVSTERYL